MDCPRCSTPLRELDLGEFGGEHPAVVIDLCPECEGVWLDKGELDQRDESVWTDAEALDFEVVTTDAPPADCPKCSETLSSIAPSEVHGLVIDRCPNCLGFWLDSGELEWVQALAADLDSDKLHEMTPTHRPQDCSWLRWALHCYVQQWKQRTERIVRDRTERYR